MTTEEDVLDIIFDALPETYETDLYGVRPTLPVPEMYIKVNGECWRIKAERHPHPYGD
jgi:hypothetical protein